MYDEKSLRYTETCCEAQTGEAYHKLHWLAAQTDLHNHSPLLFVRSYSDLLITPHAIRGGAPLFVSLLTA